MNYKRGITICASAVLIAYMGSANSDAYNMHAKGAIHEGMTGLAEQCVAAQTDAQPENCDSTGLEDNSSWSLTANYSDLQIGSRWSDDPTRFVLKSGFPNFAVAMSGGCEERLAKIGNDKTRRAELGLLCNSHYGDMQFLHAMASPDETTSDSFERMMDWARLSYRIAVGEIGPSVGYCDYLREGNAGVISEDLLAAGLPFCDDRKKKFLFVKTGTYPKWRMHTLFSMTCKNPFQSKRCTEAIGAKGVTMAVNGASGALLHLVQDSYSQSHAVRDPDADIKEPKPKAICQPVRSFYEYVEQTNSNFVHGTADDVPKFVCEENSGIHDPVTASANVIWFIQQGQNSKDKKEWENNFVQYLTRHVFGETLVN